MADRYDSDNIEKYVEQGGTRCPSCACDELEGGPVSTGNGRATQEMSCLACDATWEDVYVLSSIQ
jgi:hypothetical protein